MCGRLVEHEQTRAGPDRVEGPREGDPLPLASGQVETVEDGAFRSGIAKGDLFETELRRPGTGGGGYVGRWHGLAHAYPQPVHRAQGGQTREFHVEGLLVVPARRQHTPECADVD